MPASPIPAIRQWKVPIDYQWSCWERSLEPLAQWVRVLQYRQEMVDACCRCLTKLQPNLRFRVCPPGHIPDEED